MNWAFELFQDKKPEIPSKVYKNIQQILHKRQIYTNFEVSSFFFTVTQPEFKSEIFLSYDSLEAITISSISSEFIIHLQDKQDLRFSSLDQRTSIIKDILIRCNKQKRNIQILLIDRIDLEEFEMPKNISIKQVKIFKQYGEYYKPEELVKRLSCVNQKEISTEESQIIFSKDKNQQKSLENFILLHQLGQGSYGKVYLCQKKQNLAHFYAIKIMKKHKIVKSNKIQHIKAEQKILSNFNHPFLVKLFYSFQTGSDVYFVMNLMKGGDLFTHMKKMGRFSEQQTKFVAACLITALGHLHNNDCIYRDLKPENILFDEFGYAHITDFGLAKFLQNENTASTFCGTAEYMAPERILDRGCDYTGDWWSLGIVIYEMIFGRPPFYSNNRNKMLKKTILKKVQFNPKIECSYEAQNLIKCLLTKSPKNRLGNKADALEIMNHEWFKDINWPMLLAKYIDPPYKPLNNTQNWLENFDYGKQIKLKEDSLDDSNFIIQFQKDFSDIYYDIDQYTQEEDSQSQTKEKIKPQELIYTPQKKKKKMLKYLKVQSKKLFEQNKNMESQDTIQSEQNQSQKDLSQKEFKVSYSVPITNQIQFYQQLKMQSEVNKNLFEKIHTLKPALTATTLLVIFCISFFVRIFSVIKYESIIHEFDPWFNFRATKYLAEKGISEFQYWFDSESWYPLGRFVGHTVFPGLMYTTVFAKKLLELLIIPLDIKHICVFTAPVFSCVTCFYGYKITKQINGKTETGLLAALLIAVIPAYLSRSVAGSYDNEAISITLLLATFYYFLSAVETGSFISSAISAISYAYLVASWGGYSFVIAFIPLFVLACLITGKFNYRVYLAYSFFYVIGNFWSMQTKFVEFKVWHKSEHLGSHFVFLLMQVKLIYDYLSKNFKSEDLKRFVATLVTLCCFGVVVVMVYMGFMGKTQFSERIMTLLDPSFAQKYIPIVASVSEHQPTTWTTLFFDLHFTLLLTPIGLYYTLKDTTRGKLFVALYFVVSLYFASVMVRLILILFPAMCIISAIGISEFLNQILKSTFQNKEKEEHVDQQDQTLDKLFKYGFCGLVVSYVFLVLLKFMMHGSIVGAEIYSSPSVVMANRDYNTGQKRIIDDFRDAYYWLRQNSMEKSKILSWWDYGYQIAGFSNRTTIVDNNTWNFTHIAQVGRVLASNEEEAYEILQDLEVDYVMVLFGGKAGFQSDDINKFLWIIRITNNVFPHIKEQDYMNQGFNIDNRITDAMKNSVMYKLNYYRFWDVYTNSQKGFDLVRRAKIGYANYELTHFEEVYSSPRWLVRIYKVKKDSSRRVVAFTPKNILDSPTDLKEERKEDEEYFFDNQIQISECVSGAKPKIINL